MTGALTVLFAVVALVALVGLGVTGYCWAMTPVTEMRRFLESFLEVVSPEELDALLNGEVAPC